MKSMKNQQGFSLVELLVVVIIIAIVAAIAIPNLLASRRAANEASAISSLRTIHSAEATYQATTGGGINYGSLAQLGTAGLIDSVLSGASGQKSGYDFVLTTGTQIYCATGAPTTPNTTGVNYFGVETDGVIYKHSAALTCTAGDLTPAGSPIQ
jgi:prepilin-type N-terminal cleavage/methylation domain-containing protein